MIIGTLVVAGGLVISQGWMVMLGTAIIIIARR